MKPYTFILVSTLSLIALSCGSAVISPETRPTSVTENRTTPGIELSPTPTVSPTRARHGAIERAFATRASDIPVEGDGTVIRVLTDDSEGSPHQRLIVRLSSGHTILITHNIEVAPRVADLRVGDKVAFKGEYAWNPQGGVVHWTHHDPRGRHAAGWLKHKGKTYQ